MKINKNVLLKLIIFLGVGFAILGCNRVSFAQMVHIKITYNGKGVSNQTYNAVNLQKAYQNIMNGNISKSVMESASWSSTQKNLGVNQRQWPGNIRLPSGQIIGPGIKHTSDEAKRIIQTLYQYGGLPVLYALNGKSICVAFYRADNEGLTITDSKGEAQANITLGYTAIINQNGTFMQGTIITSKVKEIKIETKNLISQQLNISVNNKLPKVRDKVYSAAYGEIVQYKIGLTPEIQRDGGNLVIHPSTHLDVEWVSLPYNQYNVYPDPISVQSWYPGVFSGNPSQFASKKVWLENKLASTLSSEIIGVDVTIPKNYDKDYILVNTYIDPQINLNTTITLGSQGTQFAVPVKLKSSPGTGYSMSVTIATGSGQYYNTSSPTVVAGSAQFSIVDSRKGKLVEGFSYALGKKTSSGYEIYTGGRNWAHVDDLKDINSKDFYMFKGGSQYVITASGPIWLGVNMNQTNYNYEASVKANQSLFSIDGLKMGGDYFLYEVTPPKGYKKDDTVHYFDMYQKQSTSLDGRKMTVSNINQSPIQDPALNYLIPTFSVGNNEYMMIDADGTLNYNSLLSTFRIIIGIVIFLGVLIVIMVFVVKKNNSVDGKKVKKRKQGK